MMREIYGIYEFTGNEVAKILYEELVRRGKKLPDNVGLQAKINYSWGSFNSIELKITDPIPGAKEL